MTRRTLFNSSALASFRPLTLALIATLLITVLAVQFAHAQTEKVAYSFKNRTDGMVLERCTSTTRRATRASCIAFGGADGQYPGEVLALGGNASGIVVYDTTQQGGTSGWVLYSTLSPEI